MGNFFSDVGEFLGFGSSGGSRDAYQDYLRYSQDIGQYIDRARSSLTGMSNPYIAQMAGGFGGLSEAMSQAYNQGVQGIRGATAGLTSQLRGSALASTAGAQQSAVQSARLAAGGRGGLAFGGGAGALASRAGQQASIAQSSALAQAMLSAGQLQLQGESTIAGLGQQYMQNRLGLASAFDTAKARQAQMYSSEMDRRMQIELMDTNARLQLASGGLAGGLQGEVAGANRRAGLFAGFLGIN